MKISARNQFPGKVKSIRSGAVNDEIVISVSGDLDIVAVITESSTQNLRLTEGSEVIALIKASSIVLATDTEGLVFSARNQIQGKVSSVNKGAVNAEVNIDAGNGIQLSVIVTNASADNLGLSAGSAVTAIVKASSVIVAAKK